MIPVGILAAAQRVLAPPPPGGSGASATHWRITILAHGGAATSLAEIELRETAGGADVSHTATSITANSTFDSTHVAANMIDNNASTLWASAVTGAPYSITLVFPTPRAIMQVMLQARNDAVPEQSPTLFRLESSSDAGVTWNFEMQRQTPGTWTIGEQRVFTSASRGLGVAPGTHRYWRIFIYEHDGGGYYGFTELILREGGVNRSGAGGLKTIIASDVLNTGNDAPLAFDDNVVNTGWLTNLNVPPPQWIDGDFQGAGGYGSPVQVSSFDIYGSWNVPGASPRRFALAWSDDRQNWDVAQRYSGQTGWTAAGLRTFNVF